jgi:hypothetical protein
MELTIAIDFIHGYILYVHQPFGNYFINSGIHVDLR